MIPDQLRYTKEHEWVRIDDGVATVGITHYAQSELGDIVFVELPRVGAKVEQMKPFGTIEAVKTVSDLFSPLTGEVVEVNRELETEAAIINKDPYGQGWIIKIKYTQAAEIEVLLSPEAYKDLIEAK